MTERYSRERKKCKSCCDSKKLDDADKKLIVESLVITYGEHNYKKK